MAKKKRKNNEMKSILLGVFLLLVAVTVCALIGYFMYNVKQEEKHTLSAKRRHRAYRTVDR
ncbi:hypothetical protein CVP04_05920 [Caviibacterium pharyngocola]|uniref:Uncharacterized protein n=1 Tax=Caviibacterium pharyngocola TaxID=28159 RepID=A0A2M8RVK1_9PAST|nr:hypothetical protein CVP04_05920 [Caviibacterium pharyngocola]